MFVKNRQKRCVKLIDAALSVSIESVSGKEAEEDPGWEEYREMRANTYIPEDDDER